MTTTRWVQHRSCDGEKWKVVEIDVRPFTENNLIDWKVEAVDANGAHHYLPKSEYVLCGPPEVWVDVTGQCDERDGRLWHCKSNGDTIPLFVLDCGAFGSAKIREGYRLRKVHEKIREGFNWPLNMPDRAAFIVEHRQS